MGFKFSGEQQLKKIYEINEWSFIYILDDKYFFDIGNISEELKYVHQLQNLHFALTNKELNFKNYAKI